MNAHNNAHYYGSRSVFDDHNSIEYIRAHLPVIVVEELFQRSGETTAPAPQANRETDGARGAIT